MGSIALKSLSVLLGLFFVFVGFVKLSTYVSKDLHKDLVSTQLLYLSTKTLYFVILKIINILVIAWNLMEVLQFPESKSSI